jgi:hypothetical protein
MFVIRTGFNPLNAELNPLCHLLALLGGATIVAVSRLRVKLYHILERACLAVEPLRGHLSSGCVGV